MVIVNKSHRANGDQTDAFADTRPVELNEVLIKARLIMNLAASTTHVPEDDVFGLMDSIKSLVKDIERLNEDA